MQQQQSNDESMPKMKSCGFLVTRRIGDSQEVLLMKHSTRYDLPKGHVKEGESEHDTAFRELSEETGILAADVQVDPLFCWRSVYYPTYRRLNNRRVEKTLVIFLCKMIEPNKPLQLTEHAGFTWLPVNWSLLQPIQKETIDPLLKAVQEHFKMQTAAAEKRQ